MTGFLLTEDDIKNIAARGISKETLFGQISTFKKGFPFTKLLRPASPEDGIATMSKSDRDKFSKKYETAMLSGRCMKFVPASGAATRMFRLLSSFQNRPSDTDRKALQSAAKNGDKNSQLLLDFIDHIKEYPFYSDLDRVMKKAGEDLETALKDSDTIKILEYLLGEKGLNFSDTPKGLIPFHRYAEHTRTPLEEHLVEGTSCVRDREGNVSVHFTVSENHRSMFLKHIEGVIDLYEKDGTNFKIGISCQNPSTDTLAVDSNNSPFRESDGTLLFRPGGHGALLENLSKLEGDIVFIKNIDNVAPDRLKHATTDWKKALGGYLLEIQEKIFSYLEMLQRVDCSAEVIQEILDFVKNRLCVNLPDNIHQKPEGTRKKYLFDRLNRPLRVCGMVKNSGDPGGGPFWVHNSEGVSVQIVEGSQVDPDSEEQNRIFSSSTHFNPVDLVCGLRDYRGNSFNLEKYIDHSSGFISKKSKEGRSLKALELPGLWNGSMAFWNSLFVEVPASTFTPVKTVFDLLRNEHRAVNI